MWLFKKVWKQKKANTKKLIEGLELTQEELLNQQDTLQQEDALYVAAQQLQRKTQKNCHEHHISAWRFADFFKTHNKILSKDNKLNLEYIINDIRTLNQDTEHDELKHALTLYHKGILRQAAKIHEENDETVEIPSYELKKRLNDAEKRIESEKSKKEIAKIKKQITRLHKINSANQHLLRDLEKEKIAIDRALEYIEKKEWENAQRRAWSRQRNIIQVLSQQPSQGIKPKKAQWFYEPLTTKKNKNSVQDKNLTTKKKTISFYS